MAGGDDGSDLPHCVWITLASGGRRALARARTGGGQIARTAKSVGAWVASLLRGGPIEAGLRALLYVQVEEGADERQFNAIQALRNRAPEGRHVTMPQLREMMREQAALLRADPETAVAAIAKMLPEDTGERAKLLSTIHDVAAADGDLSPDQERRFKLVQDVFGLTNSNIESATAPLGEQGGVTSMKAIPKPEAHEKYQRLIKSAIAAEFSEDCRGTSMR